MNTVELALKTMRVFLVDGSRLLNEGLSERLVELPGLEVVGEALQVLLLTGQFSKQSVCSHLISSRHGCSWQLTGC